MSNWCFTTMIFHGNKKEITDLHNKIEEWTSKNFKPNGFGTDWLGNVLGGAGLGDRIDNADPNVRLRCRGYITYVGEIDISDDSAMFNLDQETAWAPMCLLWTEIIKKLGYQTIGFSYIAEEPDMQVYEICDPYGDFPDRYYIDIYLDGEDEKNESLLKIYDDRYYIEKQYLIEALQELLKTEESDFDILKEKAEAYPFSHEDSYLVINEYQVVDEPEC